MYNEKFITSGRKEKTCYCCGGTIAIGESAYSIPGDNYEKHDICVPCRERLEKEGIEDINDVKAYWDDEDEDDEDDLDCGCDCGLEREHDCQCECHDKIEESGVLDVFDINSAD